MEFNNSDGQEGSSSESSGNSEGRKSSGGSRFGNRSGGSGGSRFGNRSGGSGGSRFGNRSGGSGGSRFGSSGGRGFSDRPREMHKIKCSSCGKEAEVPFKPTGDRPVYCKDCFMKNK